MTTRTFIAAAVRCSTLRKAVVSRNPVLDPHLIVLGVHNCSVGPEFSGGVDPHFNEIGIAFIHG